MDRHCMHRNRASGKPAIFPSKTGLRRAGVRPDERATEAIDLVESKRDGGRWPLEVRRPGEIPVAFDEDEDQPSCWNTLRALRVLHWYSTGGSR